MNKKNLLLLVIVSMFFSMCQSGNREFPLNKRYWTSQDYEDVVRSLKYNFEPDEQLPTFNDPETGIIVKKLTDQQNFIVVLDDNELGLKHRNEVASEFFNQWRDMNTIYRTLDRKDQYIYDREMIEVFLFGLGLQLRYFKLGNDQIKESADDPNSSAVKRSINSNINVLIDNYLLYLDEINNEDAFSENGKEIYAEGIKIYFTKLIDLYPNANYSKLERKIDLMYKKSESEEIKSALTVIEKKLSTI